MYSSHGWLLMFTEARAGSAIAGRDMNQDLKTT